MKRLELLFLALGVVVLNIPGMNIISNKNWWPLESGVFQLAVAVAGAGVLALVYSSRERLRKLPTQRALQVAGVGLVATLAAVWLYGTALERAVKPYVHNGTQHRALIPFGVSDWIKENPSLRTAIVKTAPPSRRGEVANVADIIRVYTQFGPDSIDPMIPSGPRNKTLAMLLFGYCTVVGLIVGTFGVLGVRLQDESAVKNPINIERTERDIENVETEPVEKVPEEVRQDAIARELADAPTPTSVEHQRLEALEIRRKQLRAEVDIARLEDALKNATSPSPTADDHLVTVRYSAVAIAAFAVGAWLLARPFSRRSPTSGISHTD